MVGKFNWNGKIIKELHKKIDTLKIVKKELSNHSKINKK